MNALFSDTQLLKANVSGRNPFHRTRRDPVTPILKSLVATKAEPIVAVVVDEVAHDVYHILDAAAGNALVLIIIGGVVNLSPTVPLLIWTSCSSPPCFVRTAPSGKTGSVLLRPLCAQYHDLQVGIFFQAWPRLFSSMAKTNPKLKGVPIGVAWQHQATVSHLEALRVRCPRFLPGFPFSRPFNLFRVLHAAVGAAEATKSSGQQQEHGEGA